LNFNTKSGVYTMPGTTTDVSARVTPIQPPRDLKEQYLEAKASGNETKAAQILDTLKTTAQATKDPATAALATELAHLRIDEAKARLAGPQFSKYPSWVTDASRPVTGPESNQIDPTSRMSPNGLYQAAQNYIATGQFPPTGRGSDPGSVAQRAAIETKAGAIAADAGMDLPALRAFYKANTQSLTQQQKSADAVQSFMNTADRNATLLEQSLTKIPDIGSPKFNKPVRDFA